ncbi:MAG: sodium:calcium antiporter [Fusobacteriaceae bacterium]
MNIYISIAILIASCLAINYFADLLGDSISDLAIKKNISPSVRGVLLDGISSSIPELLTSIAAAYLVIANGDASAFADVGVGTIGGSAIFNILIIPFLSVLVVPAHELDEIEIDKTALIRDLGVYLISVSVLFFAAKTGVLTTKTGIIMTCIYAVYAKYLLWSNKNSDDGNKEEPIVIESDGSLLGKIVCSLVPIGIAVHYCVESATFIGTELNIPRVMMALIVLAGVTSIPDTLLSIKSAKKGELDASIANAVGSNTFDILICLGFVIALAGVNLEINFKEVSFVFYFLVLSSVCYTLAFLFNSHKYVKLAMLGAPYLAFVSYLGYTL